MNTRRKIEIGLGVTTPLIVCLWILWIWRHFNFDWERASMDHVTYYLCSALPFAFLTAIGSYFDAAKSSKLGFVVLCIATLFEAAFLGFIGFFIFIWGGPLFAVMIFSPAIFSFIAIIISPCVAKARLGLS